MCFKHFRNEIKPDSQINELYILNLWFWERGNIFNLD